MPDTDDEGSVADNASDGGGARLDAITRGADEETKVRMHERAATEPAARMMYPEDS